MTKHLAPRTCVLAHTVDPERPRTATRGYLCEGHYLGLEQMLAEMPALADEAERSLTPIRDEWRTTHREEEQGHRPALSLRPTPLPFDEHVSDTARKVRDLLASWASIVVEEHPDRLHPPRFGTNPVSAFLLRWLPWIAEQPWVDDFRGELDDARKALHAALTPLRSRRVPLGPCEAEIACDVDSHTVLTCPGDVEAVIRSTEDTPVISCPACGTVHLDWRALSRKLRSGLERPTWLTVLELSRWFGVSERTVQRWAHDDHWRHDGEKPPTPRRYLFEDAQAGYRRRDKEEAS